MKYSAILPVAHRGLLACLLLLCGCGSNGHDPENTQKMDTIASLTNGELPPIITEGFATFIEQFPSLPTPLQYDTDWFMRFAQARQVQEISPKGCARYIYEKPVLNADGATSKMSKQHSYYYIGQVAGKGYISLVFTDLDMESPAVYLCNYQRDGRFISGIVVYKGGKLQSSKVEWAKEPSIQSIHGNGDSRKFTIDTTGNIIQAEG